MMKRNVRKILSLALVVILLFSMMPAAFAAPISIGTINWSSATCPMFGSHKIQYQSGGGAFGFAYTCYCGATGFGIDTNSSNHQHNLVYSADGTTGYHYVYCTIPGCTYAEYELHNYRCTCGGGGSTGTGTAGHNHQYTWLDNTTHWVSCSYFSCPYYGGKTEAHSGTNCVCGNTAGNHNHQYIQMDATQHMVMCSDPTCYYYGGAPENHSSYNCACGYNGYNTGVTGNLQWSNGSPYCNGTSYPYTPHTAVPNLLHGGYYCSKCYATATYYGTGTGTGSGTSGSAVGTAGKLYVTGYDSMTDDTYTLNESVTLSVTPSMWENNADTTNNYDFYYAWSGDAYSYNNSDIAYLDTSKSSCTAYCTVTAYAKGNTTTIVDQATIYWSANAIATNSIIYTALKGENVVLDEDDFEEFWDEQYPRGTLDYVRFTGVSSGNLYDNYAGGTTLRTDVRARGSSCYLNPTAAQIGLDDLTYVPATYGNIGTVTIQFTAYGSSSYGSSWGSSWGSSYGNTSLSGTITILYTAKEVTPIVYSITADSVALDGDDFIAKYKEVMNVTYAGNLSIQFLEAPTYGTLTLGYGNSYWYQTSGTKLTDANIGSYSFSTSATGTYSIDNLTYTPGTTAAGDTIRFACYSGSQLKFVGTVTFGASNQYTVAFTTTSGKAVTFNPATFNEADSTHLLTSGYFYFGTPSVGTLYKNYANGTGTRVTTTDTFTASDLAKVTYVPRTGYVGEVEIPYTAYTYLGAQINGTVKIYVGRSFTDVLGTSSAWAAPYINQLSAQGIVNGTDASMTKFSPTKTVSYGEALKLIMMAAGYPEQAKTGTHWASGYLTKAYSDGLVNASNIDLNANVNRDTIATITAKALKLSYASSVNSGVTAPSDSANGYVYALYNAGIINGVNQNGKNYFLGSNYITRAEISKIICMVADYEA